MRVIALNGSPRKTWSTARLLEHALAGAAESGAETELVNLYDLDYKGCNSCFACKRIGGKSYGRCAVADELAPVLERISGADVLILGSPVYFGTETGEMRSFLERLLFPFLTYTPDYASIFPGRLQVGLIYTMNASEKWFASSPLNATQGALGRILGDCELLLCTDTYQFSDYSKFVSTGFDAEAKKRRRDQVFPHDCRRAFELGARLTAAARA